MEQNTAILNAKQRIIKFNFLDEIFEIDLAEGDLEDSWNGITTKSGVVWDFNFSWQEECKPSMVLYRTYEKDGLLYTDSSNEETFEIVEQIGSFEDYFKKEINTYRVCAKVVTHCYIDIEAESKEKAREIGERTDGGDFVSEETGGEFTVYEIIKQD